MSMQLDQLLWYKKASPSKKKMATSSAKDNKPTKQTVGTKFQEEEACRVRLGKQQYPARGLWTHSGRLSLTAAMSTHSLSLVICNLESLGQEGSKVASSGCPFLGFGERPARVCRLSSLFCMFQWWGNVGKALCGTKNPAEMRTTSMTVKSMSKWAILPNKCRITWRGFHTPFVF